MILTDNRGNVNFLGYFDEALAEIDDYDGETFQLLDAGTLSSTSLSVFDPDTSITLDLNGNEADLIMYLPNGTSFDEIPAIALTQSTSGASFSSSLFWKV